MNKSIPWGKGVCQVPMFSFGSPSGFCGEVAHGHQLPESYLKYTRYIERAPYCIGHACEMHGGPSADGVRIFQDGVGDDGRPMWCAVMPDFVNLQESHAAFDASPLVAENKLKRMIAA